MDPRNSAQDVLRCHLCDTPVPPLSCDLCQIHLCKACVGEHILDASTEHKVVPIQQALSDPVYPKCSRHYPEPCRLHCKQCITPICVQCASSKEHRGHEFVDLLKYLERKKSDIQRDVLEMESSVLVKYKEIASEIKSQRAYLRETGDSLKITIDERAEKLHSQVDAIVKKLKSDVDEKQDEEFSVLKEEEGKIATEISSIEEYILHQKDLQTTRDLGRVYEYRSRNPEFRNVPPKHNVTMPTLSDNNISTDDLLAQFGSLRISRSFNQCLKKQEAQSFAPDKQLIVKTGKRKNFKTTEVNEKANEFQRLDPRQQQIMEHIENVQGIRQQRHSNPGYQHVLQQNKRVGQQPHKNPYGHYPQDQYALNIYSRSPSAWPRAVQPNLDQKNQLGNQFKQVDPGQQQIRDFQPSPSNLSYKQFLRQNAREGQQNQGSPYQDPLYPRAVTLRPNLDQTSGCSQDVMDPWKFECSKCKEKFLEYRVLLYHAPFCES